MTSCLSHTEILIWLCLRQDQVDDRDQCREEAQDQGEVVEGAHQEERVAQRVDEVDQRLGAQVGASKGTLQGLSWHGSCHGSQCTQRSRGSRFQAAALLGLNEGRRHHLPAQHQRCGTQAHAQHAASSMASHFFFGLDTRQTEDPEGYQKAKPKGNMQKSQQEPRSKIKNLTFAAALTFAFISQRWSIPNHQSSATMGQIWWGCLKMVNTIPQNCNDCNVYG